MGDGKSDCRRSFSSEDAWSPRDHQPDPQMRLLLNTLAVLLPVMATADDARLSKIVREFELREVADDSVSAHQKWLMTQGGKLDAAFLAENFERLTGEQKIE